MSQRSIPLRYIHPENPSFEPDCLAMKRSSRKQSRFVKFGDFLTIVKVRQVERINKKEFAVAVVGPIACDACKHSCKRANVMVPSGSTGDEIVSDLTFDTVKETGSAAMALQLLNPRSPYRSKSADKGIAPQTTIIPEARKSGQKTADKRLFDVEQPEPVTTPFISSADKAASQIVDDILDLQAEHPVTVGPRGELAAHQDGFQPEIPFGPTSSPTVPPAEFTVVEGADSQFRLEY